MHYEMTLHLCVATCMHAQMIDKLMNWYMCIYNTCLTDCLDKHTPWYNVQVRDTTPHPWYDTDIDVARNKKRKQENVWRRTNWRFIDNYTSPPGMNVLHWYPHTQNGLFSKSTGKGKQLKHVSTTEIARWSARTVTTWIPFGRWRMRTILSFLSVERLTISYQVCSVSTTSIGHQTKDVVSLTVLMCLIEQRTQRLQRFVVLLSKRACCIPCLQISSLITSPVLCLSSHGSQILPWTRGWCRSRWSMQLSDHF